MKTLYWLVGLLEGEGSFDLANSLRLRYGTVDLDSANKVTQKIRGNLTSGHTPTGRTFYTVQIHGILAYQWMVMLYPLMSARRKQQIKKSVEEWLRRPGGTIGMLNGQAKLTEKDIREIRRLAKIRITHDIIGKMFRVCRSNVGKIVNRKSWSHVS